MELLDQVRTMIRGLTSALSVLSAMITPTVLILATTSLLTATSSRLGRVIDRTRRIGEEIEDLARGEAASGDGDGSGNGDDEERSLLFRQLGLSARRARLLQRSMVQLYLALALFIATSIAIGVDASTRGNFAWLLVILGFGGMLLLFYTSVLLIFESRVAMRAVALELEFVYRTGERHTPEHLKGKRRRRRRNREGEHAEAGEAGP